MSIATGMRKRAQQIAGHSANNRQMPGDARGASVEPPHSLMHRRDFLCLFFARALHRQSDGVGFVSGWAGEPKLQDFAVEHVPAVRALVVSCFGLCHDVPFVVV